MDYKIIAVPPETGTFFRRQDLSALAQLPSPGERATIQGDFKSFDPQTFIDACGENGSSRKTPEGSIDYSGIRFEGEFSLKALTALIESASPGTLDLTGIRFDPKENLTIADLQSVDNKCRDYYVEGNPTGANVSGANLKRCELYNSMLKGGDLSGANLKGAHLKTDLSGANLYKAKLNIKPGSSVTLDCKALSSYLRGLPGGREFSYLPFVFKFNTDQVNPEEFKAMIALAKAKNVYIPINGMNLAGLDLSQFDPHHTAFQSLDSLEALPDQVIPKEDRPTIGFDPSRRLKKEDWDALVRLCDQKGIKPRVPENKMPAAVPPAYDPSGPPPTYDESATQASNPSGPPPPYSA